MYIFLIILTLLMCAIMVLVILSQESKGGASGQFTGGQSNQMIGAPQKMQPLERITWASITGIFLVVIFSNFFVGGGGKSILDNNNIKEAQKSKGSTPKANEKPAEKPTEKKADEKK